MICPYCKKELPNNATFCNECGQLVQQETDSNSLQKYWNEYKDSSNKYERTQKVISAQIASKRNSKRVTLIMIITLIIFAALIFIYVSVGIPVQSYSKAQELFDNRQYIDAAKAFEELDDYKDSIAMVELCKYNQAITEFENNQYEDALAIFYPLRIYGDSQYYITQCELQLLHSANNNDTIFLGSYEETPIEWIVLSKTESEALLVSKYYIDTKIANESNEGEYGEYTCWSGSTLRSWLNGEFINIAFPDEISQFLMTNTISTNEYNVENYDGWGEEEITRTTEDVAYIPSIEDVETYNLKPTALMGNEDDGPITGWLRDRGHGIAFQSTLEPDGAYGSEWHFYSSYGIRPVIKIQIN